MLSSRPHRAASSCWSGQEFQWQCPSCPLGALTPRHHGLVSLPTRRDIPLVLFGGGRWARCPNWSQLGTVWSVYEIGARLLPGARGNSTKCVCLLEEKVVWVQLLFRCMHATYSTHSMKKKYQRKAVGTIVLKSGAGDRKDLFMCLGQQNQGKKKPQPPNRHCLWGLKCF